MDKEAIFADVFRQLNAGKRLIETPDGRYAVKRTSKQGLKMCEFVADGHPYKAIEQNPNTRSRWAALAREGHKVVQFVDAGTGRFVAVAVDGKIHFYGSR
jgi:hypothetical protein